MDFTQTALPVTAPIGGYGMGGWAGAIGGLIVGSLLNGGGLLGGGGNLNTAINANQSGQIAGIESSLANIQNTMSDNATNNLLLRTNDAMDTYAQGINTTIGNTRTDIANGNFTTLSSINSLGRDATAQNNQNALFNLNSFNQVNTAMLQGFNEIGRDTATSTNQLIMGQNAMAAQMAACCCDLKSTITSDGQATRALINDIRLADLQGQLNDAKNNISNSNQTNALIAAMAGQTATIINHLVPRPIIA